MKNLLTAKTMSYVTISAFGHDTASLGRNDVAFLRPEGCEARGRDCDEDRIRNLCLSNPTDEVGKTKDYMFGGEIKPPFLKAVKRGKSVDTSAGLCYNDSYDDDPIREIVRSEDDPRDPTNRDRIVFISEPVSIEQEMHAKLWRERKRIWTDDNFRSVVGKNYTDFFENNPQIWRPDGQGFLDSAGVDTILVEAQKLAALCAATNPTDGEDYDVFERVKTHEFDKMFSNGIFSTFDLVHLNTEEKKRAADLCLRVMLAANIGTFVHGFTKIGRLFQRSDDYLVIEFAASIGADLVLRKLLEDSSEEYVKQKSNEMFAGAFEDHLFYRYKKDDSMKTKIIRVLVEDSRVDVNQILIPNGPDEPYNMTPLLMSVAEKNNEAVKLLLGRSDIEVNKKSHSEYYYTPLSLAMEMRNVEIVQMLIDRNDTLGR